VSGAPGAARPRPLIPPEALAARVGELAAALEADYRGRDPILVCVLRGATVFWADLARRIPRGLRADFIALESYREATRPGRLRLTRDLSLAVAGEDLVIVEDIIDTGRTLRALRRALALRGPASLRACVLLDKRSRREVEVPVEYVGFEIPDLFVVGYGLDHAHRFRNLPYIAALDGA
jgi:hypoxanthine phosphoribosyltransferase